MSPCAAVRICLVYDCLFPWTVGGAERWYRNLAERLAADGHAVTYLTRLQWDATDAPRLPGVRVVAVSRRDDLYGPDGNRRIAPPLRFGRGVLGHLLRHGSQYDVVHTASFPYFSLLAAAVARLRHRFGLVVDWHEVWSLAYWRAYLGPAGGLVGWLVQAACTRVPQRAYAFSRLHAARLPRGATVLEGEYAGDLTPPEPNDGGATVVFAGRHISEKRAPAVVDAVALARHEAPELRALVLGDGPERPEVLRRLGPRDKAPGFVAPEAVDAALRDALCLLLPSVREGYGLVVVEALARGTPAVVARAPDNAAVELVEEGVNGAIAASPDPEDLAAALLRVHRAGRALRERTAAWFAANAQRLSLERSLQTVLDAYAGR